MNAFELDLAIEERIILTKNGILHFPNRGVFENFLLGLEKSHISGGELFVSLSSTLGVNNGNNLRVFINEYSKISEFENTPLLDVLDQDGLVAIESYYISLDFEKEIAGVTKDGNLVPLLKNKNFSHENIQIYTFEDELLDILFGNHGISKYLGDNQENGIGANHRIEDCNTGTPKPGLNLQYRPTPSPGVTNPTEYRVTSYSQDSPPINGYIYRINAKHAYQAAALYFRLKSELEHYRRTDDPTSIFSPTQDPFMSITYWGDFTPNNRAKVFLDNCWDSCQGCSPQPANKEKVQKVHWESTRRLTQVNLHGIYRGRLGGSHAGINAIPYEFRLVPIKRN